MDLNSPETWRWIWLAAAFVFAVGEVTLVGTFFLLPFGVGAAAACITSFLDHSVLTSWVVFVLGSVLASLALWPLGRRLDRATMPDQEGVGAHRWSGRVATVLQDIPGGPSATGLARVEREEWRAESVDDTPIPAGALVRVIRVDGTRVIVEPADRATPPNPAPD